MNSRNLIAALCLAIVCETGTALADTTVIRELSIQIDILNDDKECQDSVHVEILDVRGVQVFDSDIVPSVSPEVGVDKCYWPRRASHTFVMPLSQPIPVGNFAGSSIRVSTDYDNGRNGDFDTWEARIYLTASLSSGARRDVNLSGSTSQIVNWSPDPRTQGPYTFTMSLH